jgi:hypothetical protein
VDDDRALPVGVMLTYVANDLRTGNYRADIEIRNASFNTPLRSAGQLNGSVHVPNVQDGRDVNRWLVPDATALYALWNEEPVWGGILTGFGDWDPITKTLPLVCPEFRSWFSTRLITPNPVTNRPRDAMFKWTNIDQFAIGGALLEYAQLNVQDAPPYAYPGGPGGGSAVSGVRRDASWPSTSFKPVAEAIDELSHRQNGFDWGMDYIRDPETGHITNRVEFWYPERQKRGLYSLHMSWIAGKGGNILYYRAPMDGTGRISRMWTTGEGEPPDQLTANVRDPQLGVADNVRTKGWRVYREDVRSYPSVKRRKTLQSHARSELRDRMNVDMMLVVDTYADQPDLASYVVGERTRVQIKDEWIDLDYPAARIIDRSVVDRTEGEQVRVSHTIDTASPYGVRIEVE